MIVKEGNTYIIRSHTGRRLGSYASRGAAQNRLREIEYFKHMTKKKGASATDLEAMDKKKKGKKVPWYPTRPSKKKRKKKKALAQMVRGAVLGATARTIARVIAQGTAGRVVGRQAASSATEALRRAMPRRPAPRMTRLKKMW